MIRRSVAGSDDGPRAALARGQPTNWGELGQAHDDHEVFRASTTAEAAAILPGVSGSMTWKSRTNQSPRGWQSALRWALPARRLRFKFVYDRIGGRLTVVDPTMKPSRAYRAVVAGACLLSIGVRPVPADALRAAVLNTIQSVIDHLPDAGQPAPQVLLDDVVVLGGERNDTIYVRDRTGATLVKL